MLKNTGPFRTPIILAVVLIVGQMWLVLMMFSAQLDSTARARQRNSLVVVGNPIYLMFPILVPLNPAILVIFQVHVLILVIFLVHVLYRDRFLRCYFVQMLGVSIVFLQVLLQEGVSFTN